MIMIGQEDSADEPGRILFMKMYRDAYRLSGISTHIASGEAAIASARNAVAEARRNYRGMYKIYMHRGAILARPNYFCPYRNLDFGWPINVSHGLPIELYRRTCNRYRLGHYYRIEILLFLLSVWGALVEAQRGGLPNKRVVLSRSTRPKHLIQKLE